MEWLNYHHLLYFWTVATEGSVTAASSKLGLSQPTVSAQVRRLEQALGVDLFDKVGRRMVLTETGELVFKYATQIFSKGDEMLETLKGRLAGFSLCFDVGIPRVFPQVLAHRLLRPVLESSEQGALVRCHSGISTSLFQKLATNDIDMVLSDAPMGSEVSVRAFNHLLGECSVTVMGPPGFVRRFSDGFPGNLGEIPFLLPGENTALRKALNSYFHEMRLVPVIAGEIDDPGLALLIGQAGQGIFAVPSIVAGDVARLYGLEELGKLPGVRQRFYVVSAERRIKHSLVRLIMERAGEFLSVPRAHAKSS